MATVDLTLDQIIAAVRQLPLGQRQRLLREIQGVDSPNRPPDVVSRLRKQYRMPIAKRKRMSELLAKGNAGPLTKQEGCKLDRLVGEFERKTLGMAGSLAATLAGKPKKGSKSARPRRS